MRLSGASIWSGWTPYLGALHTVDPTRPSLALDLEEPLRPLAGDAPILAAVRSGYLTLTYFHVDGQRVLLTPQGRHRYMRLYEEKLASRVRHPLAPGRVTLRQALELQVRLVGQLFAGERDELEPIQWR
jgi:CRISPR/Cas system-associated endonuclease Cas1